jgi:hypothetical protein
MTALPEDHGRVRQLDSRRPDRFGRDSRRRRVIGFASGSIFIYVRWASNDCGTFISRIDILSAEHRRPSAGSPAWRQRCRHARELGRRGGNRQMRHA